MSPKTPTMFVLRKVTLKRFEPSTTTVHSRDTSGMSATPNARVTSVVASRSAALRSPSTTRYVRVSPIP